MSIQRLSTSFTNFVREPHLPWAIRGWLRRNNPVLYRLLTYRATNPNTQAYWDRVYAAELARNDLRDAEYADLRLAILEHVPEGCHLLDVGCGTGALLREVIQNRDVRVSACDLSRVAVDAVRPLCVEARVVCLPKLPPDWSSLFDVITCTEVLEHLSSPEAAVAAMAKCLKPGGKLLVSVPDDCMHPEEFDEHVQAFDAGTLTQLLRLNLGEVAVESIASPQGNRYLLGGGTLPALSK